MKWTAGIARGPGANDCAGDGRGRGPDRAASPTADPVRWAAPYLSSGMTNSAPARMPLGHREVTYFALV